MKLNTASSAISFSRELEDNSARFYENLIAKYSEAGETWSLFITENQQNKVLVERAYYGVISDAIEGCFSFEGIDTGDFAVETGLTEDGSYADALNRAAVMEREIMKFYSAAAQVSRALIGDVARAFDRIVKKRDERIRRLEALSGKGSGGT
ncbi:hypothetical protein ACFLUE_00490 [Chloroflexota bacterium]